MMGLLLILFSVYSRILAQDVTMLTRKRVEITDGWAAMSLLDTLPVTSGVKCYT